MSVIGDKQVTAVQPVVAALPLGEVTAAALADIDNAVNIALYSGKKLGAMYCYKVSAGVMEVVVAAGSAPSDKWVKLNGASSITVLDPTVAGDVGDAAGITAQLNLVETALNSLITGLSITPA